MAVRGKFIVLEGMEGVGKSTQSQEIYKTLGSTYNIKPTYEPSRDTIFGVVARQYIEEGGTDQDYLLDLFLDDRDEHSGLVNKWLDEYDIVLCDRYELSTMVYQPRYRQDYQPGEFIKPDLNIVMMDEVGDIMRRLEARGSSQKGFESVEKVRKQYVEYFNLARSKTLDVGPMRIVYCHGKSQQRVTTELVLLINRLMEGKNV